MHRYSPETGSAKGWFTGPWDRTQANPPAISVGYAQTAIDEPHLHTQMTEIYLVARGTARLRVEQETLYLYEGDVVVIEPGEAHTFLNASPDYLHFVVHTPGLEGEAARTEKTLVPRERLGLA